MGGFRKMGKYAFKCIKRIDDILWRTREKKMGRASLYITYHQPPIQTWVQKLASTNVLKQTPNTWQIHTKGQKTPQLYLAHGKQNGKRTNGCARIAIREKRRNELPIYTQILFYRPLKRKPYIQTVFEQWAEQP